jgi:hypothetical protein
MCRSCVLTDIPRIPGLLSAMFRLIEAHRYEIRPQPASFAAEIAEVVSERMKLEAKCADVEHPKREIAAG